jgi:hypothetical protein
MPGRHSCGDTEASGDGEPEPDLGHRQADDPGEVQRTDRHEQSGTEPVHQRGQSKPSRQRVAREQAAGSRFDQRGHGADPIAGDRFVPSI